jgi:hypothetical protein
MEPKYTLKINELNFKNNSLFTKVYFKIKIIVSLFMNLIMFLQEIYYLYKH